MEKPDPAKSRSTKEIENCLDYYEIRIKRSLRDPKFVLEAAGFVVLFVYAVFTILMYFANNRAATAAGKATRGNFTRAHMSAETLCCQRRRRIGRRFQDDNSGRQPQFHLLWGQALGCISAQE
jgi:hypothetical protein